MEGEKSLLAFNAVLIEEKRNQHPDKRNNCSIKHNDHELYLWLYSLKMYEAITGANIGRNWSTNKTSFSETGS